MSDENMSRWTKTALRLLAVPAEMVVSAHGLPGLVSAGGIMLEAVAPERKRDADEFAGVVIAFVGRDKLFEIVQSDDERREMLWTGAMASMATGVEGKRIVMARVVANAMTSDEPIDDAQLMLWALAQLEAPHFRTLTLLRDVHDANLGEKNLSDAILAFLRTQHYSVLATLARTGVVRQGSEKYSTGLYTATFADTLGISGISDFGRELLADLESADTRY
ncbi:hypothetical protein CIW49_26670 [Mycolicibacterium sp. P1-18]|uniref:hypothetical protein n=1 Tax=Mycolicibacterium sp. P1-18 TaxID=2024615 RepID=UPI0011F0A58F|nr:hypothetical protein [Mycolicibacterium sp. P1-18]KAA0093636.1 hypothetical protein CIW49_26670 [Mycolicibacterium sp. P1-18]